MGNAFDIKTFSYNINTVYRDLKIMTAFKASNSIKHLELAFSNQGAASSETWDSLAESDKRFVDAQQSLIAHITVRLYTTLAQEAYKLTRGESTRVWINIFSYFYPRTSLDIKAGKVAPSSLNNMWWANFPTVSLINGPKNEGAAIFNRLNILDTETAVRQAVEYPGSPFRLFVFNSGKRVGNVFQVRWDGCVGASYINHCAVQGRTPDVRENETILTQPFNGYSANG